MPGFWNHDINQQCRTCLCVFIRVESRICSLLMHHCNQKRYTMTFSFREICLAWSCDLHMCIALLQKHPWRMQFGVVTLENGNVLSQGVLQEDGENRVSGIHLGPLQVCESLATWGFSDSATLPHRTCRGNSPDKAKKASPHLVVTAQKSSRV